MIPPCSRLAALGITCWMVLCTQAALRAGEPIVIVALGDSITKGVRSGVSAEETFAARLQAALMKRGADASVTNVGIGGERTDQALVRLKRDVLSLEPHFVLVMYGTNDSYVDRGRKTSRLTEEQYRDNLVSLVERIRAAGAVPVLMTEPRWAAGAAANGAGEHPNVRLASFVEICREVAEREDVALVDHFARWTAAEREEIDLAGWTTDHCHPNPHGHTVLTETILAVLVPLIDRRAAAANQSDDP